MKKNTLVFIVAMAAFWGAYRWTAKAADSTMFQLQEFATIRWAGRENTFLVRPSGKVEKLRALLEKAPRPEGIDDRAYYMNIAINAVAKEGFEFAGMTNDEIVMRRALVR